MSAARQLTQSDKQRALKNLPPGTTRVQVRDENGKQAWRKPEEVKTADQLIFNNSGPVVMMGKPGRKTRPQLEPISDNIAEVIEAKELHLKEDNLTLALTNPDDDGVLDIVMRELSQEAASLEFERFEAERNGRDTSGYSLRRARILQAVGDMFLKRKEKLEAGKLDLDSPGARALFTFLLETVRGALTDCGVRGEVIETTFAKLGKRLDDAWMAEARLKMREAK
jgi:hypothetical protein